MAVPNAIPGQDPPPQDPKYAIGVIVITQAPGDQGRTGTLFTDIGALLVGRDPEPTDPTTFNRYVLSGYTTPDGGEYDVKVYVAVETRVAPGIRQRILDGRFQINPLQQEMIFGAADYTDAQVEARLRQWMGQDGREACWIIRLGADLTGDLPSKFGPI